MLNIILILFILDGYWTTIQGYSWEVTLGGRNLIHLGILDFIYFFYFIAIPFTFKDPTCDSWRGETLLGASTDSAGDG